MDKAKRIAALNDQLRTTFTGGRVMMTRGLLALPEDQRHSLLRAVQAFTDFNKDNDPYGEHDLVRLKLDGQCVIAKIDYYDPTMTYHSEDAANPDVTCRVMTVMLCDEY